MKTTLNDIDRLQERIEALEAVVKQMKLREATHGMCDLPITALPLSSRAVTVLKSNKISTIGELIQLSSKEVGKFRNTGVAVVAEIEKELAGIGLKLRQ